LTATYENVPGLVLMKKHRKYLRQIVLELLEIGYQVRYCIMNASEYGDPQYRNRLFLFVARNDIPLPNVPSPTHGEGLLPKLTVRQVIGFLPEPMEEWTEKPTKKPKKKCNQVTAQVAFRG
jgi:DNA (cytosine-5)-methyltransferase 1